MLVTEHFAVSEFAQQARHGLAFAPYPIDWIGHRLRPLCEALEVLRAELGGAAVTVISGYRAPAYNRRVGGARRSQHLEGRAADIVVAGVPARQVHEAAIQLYQSGHLRLGGLGRYPGFTHLDVRESTRLVQWTGSRTRAATEGV